MNKKPITRINHCFLDILIEVLWASTISELELRVSYSQTPVLLVDTTEDMLRSQSRGKVESQSSGGIRQGKGDCPKEREDANNGARNGNEGAYVPECDKNGKLNM